MVKGIPDLFNFTSDELKFIAVEPQSLIPVWFQKSKIKLSTMTTGITASNTHKTIVDYNFN